MGLELLKFGDKEIYLSLAGKATEKLLESGVCTRSKITSTSMLKKLREGEVLVPYSDGYKFQKIKTLKSKGECVRMDGASIPLLYVKDICAYIKTGKKQKHVSLVERGQKTTITFLKDFAEIKKGATITKIYNNTITTQFGVLDVTSLIKHGYVTKTREPYSFGHIKIKSSRTSYGYGSYDMTYDIEVSDSTVQIGCKSFEVKKMIQLGNALDIYLDEE